MLNNGKKRTCAEKKLVSLLGIYLGIYDFSENLSGHVVRAGTNLVTSGRSKTGRSSVLLRPGYMK